MPANVPVQPWLAFLTALDKAATAEVSLYCAGGFVVTQLYGFDRNTSDLDTLAIAPTDQAERLMALGQEGSKLHEKCGVYLDRVAVANFPQDYKERLIPMYVGVFTNLRLFALEAHDLALTKLERNIQRDRDDVKHLARTGKISPEILKDRYEKELKVYLGNPGGREDNTIRLWIEMITEERETSSSPR
jgi:hypothetical protein